MNTQFKKGVLELIVLNAVNKTDMYGYELVVSVSKVVDVNEGTIYPLLKRLTNDKCFVTYIIESNEGPPRKYYKITPLGISKLEKLIIQWTEFSKNVENYLKGVKEND